MNKISTYRKQLGLSQRQLATHLGWIQSRLANYEANFRTPGLEECRKIVATLIGTLNVTTTSDNVKGITDDARRRIRNSALVSVYSSGVTG